MWVIITPSKITNSVGKGFSSWIYTKGWKLFGKYSKENKNFNSGISIHYHSDDDEDLKKNEKNLKKNDKDLKKGKKINRSEDEFYNMPVGDSILKGSDMNDNNGKNIL